VSGAVGRPWVGYTFCGSAVVGVTLKHFPAVSPLVGEVSVICFFIM